MKAPSLYRRGIYVTERQCLPLRMLLMYVGASPNISARTARFAELARMKRTSSSVNIGRGTRIARGSTVFVDFDVAFFFGN